MAMEGVGKEQNPTVVGAARMFETEVFELESSECLRMENDHGFQTLFIRGSDEGLNRYLV
ncbi:hypothetical protein D9M68_977130 [compost metagenome]